MNWLRKQVPTLSRHRALLTQAVQHATLQVIDLEMNSLDPRTGSILSAGSVTIHKNEILVATARHWLIDSTARVGDSATVHGLRNLERQYGNPLCQVLSDLHRACDNRVMVFHHAGLDLAFLNRAADELGLPRFDYPVIDTLQVEQKRLLRQGQILSRDMLTLETCRRRYGLPSNPAHNALEDALATAELLLSLVSAIGKNRDLPVNALLT